MQSFNLLDWGIVVYLAYGGLRGLFRGFGRTLAATIGGLAAWVASAYLVGSVRHWLDQAYHAERKAEVFVSQHLYLPAQLAQQQLSGAGMEQLRQELLARGVPTAVVKLLMQSIQTVVASNAHPPTVAQFVYQAVAHLLVGLIAFTGLFLVISTAARIAGSLLDLGLSAAGLGLVGRFAGLLTGGAYAAVLASLILGVVVPFLTVSSFLGISHLVQGSQLAQLLLTLFYQVSPWVGQVTGGMI